MKAHKENHQSNPNIGLFIFANDKVCICGKGFDKDQLKYIEDTLQVPLYSMSIAGSELVGVFLNGNNKGIVAPNTINNSELEILRQICEEHNLNLKVIDSDLNALGNNILCNDDGCLINPEYVDKVKEQIEKTLEVKTERGTLANLDNVGSMGLANSKGCLVSEEVLEEEIKILERLLNCKILQGRVNNNPYVRSGVVVNSNGMILSDRSLGEEILKIHEAFNGE
jgi:translation initiation factor 6